MNRGEGIFTRGRLIDISPIYEHDPIMETWVVHNSKLLKVICAVSCDELLWCEFNHWAQIICYDGIEAWRFDREAFTQSVVISDPQEIAKWRLS